MYFVGTTSIIHQDKHYLHFDEPGCILPVLLFIASYVKTYIVQPFFFLVFAQCYSILSH